MKHRARIVSASFAPQEYLRDATIVLFAELEHGALVRVEDTGPKSYLCKLYLISTTDTGKDDFRNILGKAIFLREEGTEYYFEGFE